MYFTLWASGPLVDAALAVDPAIMPVPGPPGVAWRSDDGQAALLTWPAVGPVTQSYSGSISPGSHGTRSMHADRVYQVDTVLSDRAMWAAAAAGRLDACDPMLVAQLLNVGYPLGATTPFGGVSAMGGSSPSGGNKTVAEALVAAIEPLAKADVELSLTGGKDSRLVAAALAAADVPFRAKTHGSLENPDVEIAGLIARRLGVEHVIATPTAPGDEVDPLARIRASVLVGDGMISAFENIGRPDPVRSEMVSVGGHGGELLRGGYAEILRGRAPALRGVELLRRLTTRRTGLLRPRVRAAYLASLTPWFAAVGRSPLAALDDFYLVNRTGRWSAAARQAYLIREDLRQPLFDDAVVSAARRAPIQERVSGALTREATAALRADLLDIPFAPKANARTFDWRRDYGPSVASFFRDYILSADPLFEYVRRRETERLLGAPDTGTVWSLATLACLVTGDYRNARTPSPRHYPATT